MWKADVDTTLQLITSVLSDNPLARRCANILKSLVGIPTTSLATGGEGVTLQDFSFDPTSVQGGFSEWVGDPLEPFNNLRDNNFGWPALDQALEFDDSLANLGNT